MLEIHALSKFDERVRLFATPAIMSALRRFVTSSHWNTT